MNITQSLLPEAHILLRRQTSSWGFPHTSVEMAGVRQRKAPIGWAHRQRRFYLHDRLNMKMEVKEGPVTEANM